MADRDGLHIRNGNRAKNSIDSIEYATYEVWDGDNFICATFGPCSASMAAHICQMFDRVEAGKYLKNGEIMKWFVE